MRVLYIINSPFEVLRERLSSLEDCRSRQSNLERVCTPETPVVQDRDGIEKSCGCHIGRVLLVPAPHHPGREKEVRLSSCEGPPSFPQGQTEDEVHTGKMGVINEEPSGNTGCSLREGRGVVMALMPDITVQRQE